MQHSERVARGLCAGCRAPIADGVDALDLADGNRVHLDPDYRCLIAWGDHWRSAAKAGIIHDAGYRHALRAAQKPQPAREESVDGDDTRAIPP